MSNEGTTNQGQSEHGPASPQAHVHSSEHQVVIEASAKWEGPLPPPQALQGYDAVLPGAANRILEMVGRQSEHRIQMEKAIIEGGAKRAYLGIAAAFALSVMVIGGGIFLISSGHDWAGVCLIGLNLVGLASVFVYGSKSRKDDQRQVVEMSETES